jgi:hypothetical protein
MLKRDKYKTKLGIKKLNDDLEALQRKTERFLALKALPKHRFRKITRSLIYREN